MSINLGSHKILHISYDQIEPGDFVCTYEALNTRKDLLLLENILYYANPQRASELNKMFHAEVIIQKYPRIGLYKIAHADGSCQKVRFQDDNFKDHHPGQAFIIFRAKDKAIRKEIVAIAEKTSEENNGHICAPPHIEILANRIRCIFNYFLFERARTNASTQTLNNIMCILNNYNKYGKFYAPDGSGIKTMSCIEYVANVINVATIRVFLKKTDFDHQEKSYVESIVHRMNAERGFPFKFSHPHASPASFVEFFLKHTENFHTIGYLGTITHPLDGPRLDIKGAAVQASPHLMTKLLLNLAFVKNPENSDLFYAAQVMKTLGILDHSWQLYTKAARDHIKIKTLFVSIHHHVGNFDREEILNADLDRCTQEFIHRLEWLDRSSIDLVDKMPFIEDLSPVEAFKILEIEKKFLQSTPLERTDRTLKLSINYLDHEMVRIRRLKLIANQQLSIAKILRRTLILSPLSLIGLVSGYALNKIALNAELICKKKLDDILRVHEKVRKNGAINIHSNKLIDESQRFWIEYSCDMGTSWNLDYFELEQKTWIARLQIPVGQDIQYKLLIGPKNVNDEDPRGKADVQTEIQYIDHKDIQIKWENNSENLILPVFHNPTWIHKGLTYTRSSHVYNYAHICSSKLPQEYIPLSIQEYENIFTRLEENSTSSIREYYQGESLEKNISLFVEKELKLKLLTDKIQLLPSGIGQGLSGDLIYKILDKNQNCILVIKVYMKSKGKFSREFFSLLNHEKLNLNLFQFPKVAGFGASKINNQRIYFLAMDYIHGVSLHNFFTKLISYPVLSQGRDTSFNELLSIYSKLGRALAEFHVYSKGDSLPLHPLFINLFNAFYKNALKRFEGYLDPILIENINKYFQINLPIQTQKMFIRSYHHGDINAGNIIYENRADRLSIIDWSDGSLSIGKDGKPLGLPFFDLIQIKNELLSKKAQGATENEIIQLYNTFEEEYNKNGIPIPSRDTMNFFSSIDLMGSLKWFIDRVEQFKQDPDQFKIAENIYHEKLTQLILLIKTPSL